jgi:hypothetical protein
MEQLTWTLSHHIGERWVRSGYHLGMPTQRINQLFFKAQPWKSSKDRYDEPERGGSEWEPIKIILEGDTGSNKVNTASNTRLRLNYQIR